LLGLADVRDQVAVADVRHRGQHVLQAVQAELDERVRIAVDVQVGEAVHQVPAVLHVIRPGDVGELVAAALALQVEGEGLVVALPAVVQVPHDLRALGGAVDLVEIRGGAVDGQRAAARAGIAAGPAHFGTGAESLAGPVVLDVRIVRVQHRELGQATEVREHVVDLAHVLADHQRTLDVAAAGHDHRGQHADADDDGAGHQKFKNTNTHHSRVSERLYAVLRCCPSRRAGLAAARSRGDDRGSANAEGLDVTCSCAGTPSGSGMPYGRLQGLVATGLPDRAGRCAAASAGAWKRRRAVAQTMPSSSAFSTARVRSRTPSLERMLETWFFTVPSATFSELAISLS